MWMVFLGSSVLMATARFAFGAPQPTVEIPLSYRDGMIWVRLATDRVTEPLNFLLDTGASASVLDRQTAGRLGLKLAGGVPVRGVGTQMTGSWTTPVTMRAGDVVLKQRFLAIDLQKLSRACEQPVDGLLGADFFRGRVVQIDYAAERLRLLSAAPGRRALPLRIRREAMCVPIRVDGGAPQWVRLDTGCASALQWVTPRLSAACAANQISIGMTKTSAPVVETTVELGTERIESVPTGLHRRALFAGEAGLLGNGLLSRYAVTIDAARGRVILE
jgi:predicted aspartyl protease